MNYTLLSDFCTIYRIPKIREKLNTLYPNIDEKIPYTKEVEKHGLTPDGVVKRRILGEEIGKAVRFPVT